MNRLILIGNGFDLAHGMATQYGDFMQDYIFNAFGLASKLNFYEDDLIAIQGKTYFTHFGIDWQSGLREYLDYFHNTNFLPLLRNMPNDSDGQPLPSHFKVTVKSPFLEHLLLNCKPGHWVDIENEFYSQLKVILNHKNEEEKVTKLKELNFALGKIIGKIEAYLTKLPKPPAVDRNKILFHSDIKEMEVPLEALERDTPPEQTYIVNFNYTDTISQYFNERTNPDVRINFIHGKLNDPDNRLIFGFGDELDEDYGRMEKERIKGYFEYIKSFWYFKTRNYRDLIRFIDGKAFQVFIMGHSCGLSDRTMLNMIFEHVNCVSIKIFYYQDGDSNNYFDLTQEIARHFSNKEMMRRKIVSEDLCERMAQHNNK